MEKIKVIIVGGGFGGLTAAQSLAKNTKFDICLIDRRNFHLFQPLLYQVAMAGLSPTDIAIPLRTLFSKHKNVHIVLAEVDDLDLVNNKIQYDHKWIKYDYLILSCGAKHSYFGNEDWEVFAPGLKTIEQAIEIRRRVLTAFEIAEKEINIEKIKSNLTFVVVGGGPTGVEIAGAISEMAKKTLLKDYKNADLRKTKVILVEAGSRILSGFPEGLARIAEKNLLDLGVKVLTNSQAKNLSNAGLFINNEFISAKTIIWAAGVLPSSLTNKIPGEKDIQGRAVVCEDLSLEHFKNVFVIGDQASCKSTNGEFLPGIAPVAIQQGHFLKKVLQSDIKRIKRPKFKYRNKGVMATIGRSKAIVHTKFFDLSGLTAWLVWVFIHLFYLMKFKNRFFILLNWIWSYFTFGNVARLITLRSWKFYDTKKIIIEQRLINDILSKTT